MTKLLIMLGFASVGAFAADPAWFTDVQTQMGDIAIMVGTAISAIVAVKVAPLVWNYVKPILFRG